MSLPNYWLVLIAFELICLSFVQKNQTFPIKKHKRCSSHYFLKFFMKFMYWLHMKFKKIIIIFMVKLFFWFSQKQWNVYAFELPKYPSSKIHFYSTTVTKIIFKTRGANKHHPMWYLNNISLSPLQCYKSEGRGWIQWKYKGVERRMRYKCGNRQPFVALRLAPQWIHPE